MNLTDDVLQTLAPASLLMYRVSRYRADDQTVALASFDEPDRAALVKLYDVLRELKELFGSETGEDGSRDVVVRARAREVLERWDFWGLIRALQRFGRSAELGSRLAEVVHDVRGGALNALSMELERAVRLTNRPGNWRSLFILSRDHAKVMRNVVDDLDPEARLRDLAIKPHGTRDLARALAVFPVEIDDRVGRVTVDCRTDAMISESCVELGAVDRILYNLVNNAVRHTSDPNLFAWILPVGTNLRFVLANDVSPDQRDALEGVLAGGALPIAYTTTGSGLGLRIVTELVASAYGIPALEDVTRDGYYGAKLLGTTFVTWFHWPAVGA